MAAYIAGMESDYDADDEDEEPDEETDYDDAEHWKREAESAEERFQVERQTVYDERRKQERFVAEKDTAVAKVVRLEARVRQLEAQRNEVKLQAQKRITEAMGEYGKDWTGDWLDEAVERLTRKRSMTVEWLAGQLRSARHLHGADDNRVVQHLCEMLGVTLRS